MNRNERYTSSDTKPKAFKHYYFNANKNALIGYPPLANENNVPKTTITKFAFT